MNALAQSALYTVCQLLDAIAYHLEDQGDNDLAVAAIRQASEQIKTIVQQTRP